MSDMMPVPSTHQKELPENFKLTLIIAMFLTALFSVAITLGAVALYMQMAK